MKNQKGITLIALVITIIVMLILVVVTVTFALGDDGIIGNARTGATKQKVASLKEAFTMAKADITTDVLAGNETTEPDVAEFKTAMSKYLDAKLQEELTSTVLTKTGKTITLTLTSIDAEETTALTFDMTSLFPAES